MHRRLAILVLTATLAAAPALAQERPPAERQTLTDLAYALGESHALRQACAGDGDQYWRERMMRMTETEAADAGFSSRLTQAFNAGYATRQSEFPDCGPASKRAEQAVARKGQALAGRLSSITRVIRNTGPAESLPEGVDPDSVAEAPTPH
ncbi:TIGR02301 family protein [Caulobacter mirabilis]|uniref:TIGR02301 family protein n=1 Tax=Caulobacter mirabilis TaxID=69666 RepID=A0A2D2ATH4_9CAUL|nr:TIGR02301 family protein [Caulobacter mirabilis]ATQ41299.1 TIGR02301 family protein [Caulobacter mirabilis]